MGNKPRVLLVDDNPVNLKVATKLLEKKDLLVDAVSNGRLAIEAIQKAPYQMILMDVQLPEMDGLQTTKMIREWEMSSPGNEDRPRTPIIALTAADTPEEKAACLEAGMDDVILKPLRPDKVEKVLAYVTGDLKNRQTLSATILERLEKSRSAGPATNSEIPTRQLMTFMLGNESYAFDMCFMTKIRWAEGITPVPGLPPHILGIINLRGEIVSVVDLKALLGIQLASVPKPSIMVTRLEGVEVGFLVDSVDEIVELPIKSINPPMITFEKEYLAFIDGEARLNERLLVVLNYQKIMASEKLNIHKK